MNYIWKSFSASFAPLRELFLG
jgi:uncharacterized protein (DUF433 family)